MTDYQSFRTRFKGKAFFKDGKEISCTAFFFTATAEQIAHPEIAVEIKDKRFWENGVYLLADREEDDTC